MKRRHHSPEQAVRKVTEEVVPQIVEVEAVVPHLSPAVW